MMSSSFFQEPNTEKRLHPVPGQQNENPMQNKPGTGYFSWKLVSYPS